MLTLEEKQFVNNYLKKVAGINAEELVKEAAYEMVNETLTKTASDENSSYWPMILGLGALGLGGLGLARHYNQKINAGLGLGEILRNSVDRAANLEGYRQLGRMAKGKPSAAQYEMLNSIDEFNRI